MKSAANKSIPLYNLPRMTLKTRRQKTAEWISLLLVILLSGLVLFFISRQVLAFSAYPFDSDEANHALGALQMAQALDDGDFGRFTALFYAQDFYPPGFDLVKAISFVAFGSTPAVARLVSVTSLFLALLLIYALGLEFDAQWGWLAGLVAVLLTLTMQPLLTNSALVMMEAPGLLVSFAFLYAYLQAIKRPSTVRLLLTSALLILTFLTKYTYGVVAVAVLLVMELSLLWPLTNQDGQPTKPNGRSHFTYLLRTRWLWLFAPFLVTMLIWFSRSNKLTTFFTYTRPLSDAEPWFTLQNMIYYPRSIMMHDTPAPIASG